MTTPDLRPLIALADAHAEADEYIAGIYWDHGSHRGCSLGCTIHDAMRLGLLPKDTNSDDHGSMAHLLYDDQEWVAGLQEEIFEEMADEERPGWTPRLLRAVIGYRVSWQRVWHRWASAVLRRVEEVFDPDGVVSRVRRLHNRALTAGPVPDIEWSQAEEAAWEAAKDHDWHAARVAAWAADEDGEDAMSEPAMACYDVAADEASRQADDLIAAIEAEREPV